MRQYDIVLRHTEYDQTPCGGWRETTKRIRAHDAADALVLAMAGVTPPTLSAEGWVMSHGWRIQSAVAVEEP